MSAHPSLDANTVELIKKYYRGCNTGDIELLMSTMTDNITHYFLQPGTTAVRGAEHLARYWRKVQKNLNARWEVDYAIAKGPDAVIEWTIFWTNPENGSRLTSRGAEFYVIKDGLISEIRAYYNQLPDANSELVDFDYRQRGYFIEDIS